MSRSLPLVLLAALVAPSLPAQNQEKEIHIQRMARPAGGDDYTWNTGPGDGPVLALHGADIRFEGPAVEGAPYSAEAVTETTQTLADGNRIRRENTAKIFRDSQGRIRREETIQAVGPWATGDPQTTVFINDPVSNTHYILHPAQKTVRKMQMPELGDHVAFLASGGAPTNARMIRREEVKISDSESGPKIARAVSIRTPMPSGEPEREDLGTQAIEGVQAQGVRLTTTIPAEQVGADRPIVIVDERWRSTELGVDVLTKHSDPRMGETVYRLTNIVRGEQPITLFEAPADYDVQESDIRIQRRIERSNKLHEDE